MGLFRRKNKGRSGLLTATISARGGSWEVIWIGDGMREPPGFAAGSLTEAAEQAAAAAFSAGDSMGLGADVRAATLEDLTAEIARQPGGSDALLQWTRPVAGLPPADLAGGP
jgi:hypothetical protein